MADNVQIVLFFYKARTTDAGQIRTETCIKNAVYAREKRRGEL